MQYSLKSGDPAKLQGNCLIVGIFSNSTLSSAARALDRASKGALSRLLKKGDIKGDAGQSLLLYDLPGIKADRVLLVGLGEEKKLDLAGYRKACMNAARQLGEGNCGSAVNLLSDLTIDGASNARLVREGVTATGLTLYRFEQCKSDKKTSPRALRRMAFHVSSGSRSKRLQDALAQGQAIADGCNLARDLANLPGNICTPQYLADQARKLAAGSTRLKRQVLDEKKMAQLGMGALLSVSRGSRQPAKLIVLEYKGGKAREKPVVLVGKGLTFDAGGISLKPAATMDEMKYDMCGGASVLGTLAACAALELPINLVGIIPASENLPDGDANKPGDIVTSMSGQTIEILNTDAEGRLILCDALTYAKRFKPELVIDIATLTGACVVALGDQASGLLSNDDALANELLQAGQAAGDRAWQLPLWEDYQEQLKSNFADMANIGGKGAGTITAACFLSRFTRDYKWAHLDIAGIAWLGGSEKGATGRPVPLLVEFLLKRCGQSA